MFDRLTGRRRVTIRTPESVNACVALLREQINFSGQPRLGFLPITGVAGDRTARIRRKYNPGAAPLFSSELFIRFQRQDDTTALNCVSSMGLPKLLVYLIYGGLIAIAWFQLMMYFYTKLLFLIMGPIEYLVLAILVSLLVVLLPIYAYHTRRGPIALETETLARYIARTVRGEILTGRAP